MTAELLHELSNTTVMEHNTGALYSKFDPYERRSTLVNIDKYIQKPYSALNGAIAGHDPIYYEMLANIKPPQEYPQSDILDHYIDNIQDMNVMLDPNRNNIVN